MISRAWQAFHFGRTLLESYLAAHYAAGRNLPGMEFEYFGRRIAYQLALRNRRRGIREYLLTPVNLGRHWEYAFAWKHLQGISETCLDVSSPRLFSLFAADRFPGARIDMINPDVCDIEITQDIANALSLTSIQTAVADVRELAKCAGKYDAIWSISVVEHIAGSTTDSEAVKLMFDALRPGGRLIVTVPVDKTFWAEYRTLNHYGTQSATATGKYFFQHFYDEAAIRERLIAPLGVQPSHMEWYGETTHGRFHTYIQEWLHHGSGFAAGAAREEVDHYRVFPNWDVMPGAGVCGFVIKKPHTP